MTVKQIENMYGVSVPAHAYVRVDDDGQVTGMTPELAQTIIRKMTGSTPIIEAPDEDEDGWTRPLKTSAELEQAKRERNTLVSQTWWSLEQDARRQTMLAQWAVMADKPFIPKNEFGVILLFGTVMHHVGWQLIDVRPNLYPDGVFLVDGRVTLVEFEFASANFITHNHDTRGADMVICWEHNKRLDIPVIDLSKYYTEADKSWNTNALRAALQQACTATRQPLQIVA